jgi:hypothetical protein
VSNAIGAARGHFDDDVAGVGDEIEVIAKATNQAVVARATSQRVVAGVADQGVVAGFAAQRVVAASADEAVVDGVAGAGERRSARVGEVLDVGTQGVAGECSVDSVKTLAGRFAHDIVHAVDEIEVVAFVALKRVVPGAADQGVVAEAAEEAVVAVKAGEDVGLAVPQQGVAEAVAGEVDADRGVADLGVLDVCRERVGAAGGEQDIDLIGSLAEEFGDGVRRNIDRVAVVAEAADEGVDAGVAVERVVAVEAGEEVGRGIAEECVVEGIAGHVHAGRAVGDGGVFDVGGERVPLRRPR